MRLAQRIAVTVAAVVYFLLWLAPAVDAAYIHLVRTPVTATITYCSDNTRVLPCSGDWALDDGPRSGWVRRLEAAEKGEVVDAAILDGETVLKDPGLSTLDRVALAGGAALPVLVPGVLYLRRCRVRTILLSVPVTLGAVAAAAGVVLLAVGLNYGESMQATHGSLLLAAGAALMLPAIPVWYRGWAAARAAPAVRATPTRTARPPSTPLAPMWWNTGSAVSPVVAQAVTLARQELPPAESLTTGRLLAALARVDPRGDWNRIWRLFGDPVRTGLADAPDPPGSAWPGAGAAPTWAGTRLSRRLADALTTAGQIGQHYDQWPVPAGVIALGLLARRGNGATEALLAGGATHARLLREIQSRVLHRRLPGLDAMVRAAE